MDLMDTVGIAGGTAALMAGLVFWRWVDRRTGSTKITRYVAVGYLTLSLAVMLTFAFSY